VIPIDEIIQKRKQAKAHPTDEDLRRLPDRKAFINGRSSTTNQIIKSMESLREIASLVDLAKQDGYKTNLDSGEVWRWLEQIRANIVLPGVLEDGDVILDCQDLGISGTLNEAKRPGLAHLKRRLQAGELGAIYVTEGASRLARDRDRVVSSSLLQLMTDSNCKLRTPDQVLSPCIERDWDIIDEDFVEAREELKVQRKRLHRRKMTKAKRGEHVGSAVPPGFKLPIVDRRADGSYIFGKYELYQPHLEINKNILKEFIKWKSKTLAARSLRKKYIVYPFFPEELSYMNSRTSLRRSPRSEEDGGYVITPEVIEGVVANPKQIGIWICGDTVIRENHPSVFSGEMLDLWLQANEIMASRKPKGKGAIVDPMPFAGLLFCGNHDELWPISPHNIEGRLRCTKDYGIGAPICLDVVAHIVVEPLTQVFLERFKATAYIEDVLRRTEEKAREDKLEDVGLKQNEKKLKQRIDNLKNRLGYEDNRKDEILLEEITKTERQLASLQQRLVQKPRKVSPAVDIARIREFLWRLWQNWDRFPNRLKNELLRLFIERVELRHSRESIEATIVWGAGERQAILIQRPKAKYARERRWKQDEDKLLKMLWPSSRPEAILAALPCRSWEAVGQRALRLGVKRQRTPYLLGASRHWTDKEKAKLTELYESGIPVSDVAAELGRSQKAIVGKTSVLKLNRPREVKWRRLEPTWIETKQSFDRSEAECSRLVSSL
jgi:hypothetical protein